MLEFFNKTGWNILSCSFAGRYRGENRATNFAILQIWREPIDHSSNCFFYMVDPSNHRAGMNVPAIIYPDLLSSINPVSHCPKLPIPTPPERERSHLLKRTAIQKRVKSLIQITEVQMRRETHTISTPKDVNNLIRDLGLTKSNAMLLMSKLKQWNLQVIGQSAFTRIY